MTFVPELGPACPNCGRPMTLASAEAVAEDQNTFECPHSILVYVADEHVPVTGLRKLDDQSSS